LVYHIIYTSIGLHLLSSISQVTKSHSYPFHSHWSSRNT